jgi:hypothetical protein
MVFVCSEKVLPSASLPIKRIAISIAIRLLRRAFGGDVLTEISILISRSGQYTNLTASTSTFQPALRHVRPSLQHFLPAGWELKYSICGPFSRITADKRDLRPFSEKTTYQALEAGFLPGSMDKKRRRGVELLSFVPVIAPRKKLSR